MTELFGATPFGGGRVSVADFQRREAVERKRSALKNGGNDNGRADKWQLIRALSEARGVFGLSDRTIVVLEALLSFHTPREIDGSEPIVVFPSNAELSLRSRGMAEATLRRHIAALVEAGLILRRDSANGKRYCRRDERGTIADAFGFDLSPLALAAGEIYAAAEAVRDEARALQKLRTEISIHLRDTGKVIEAGLAERLNGDWASFLMQLQPLAKRLPRQAERSVLERRREDLVALRARVEKTYLDSFTEQEMSGNDSHFERHYQNSNTDPQFELSSETEPKREVSTKIPNEAAKGSDETHQTAAPEQKGETAPLAYVLGVCPTLASYAKDGINDWRDAISTAELVRAMLGISPDAWRRACEAMGTQGAAITVAAILERADGIRSPGGYLRALTERAEQGKFSVRPMLAALEGERREVG
ncbi:plasmid replication protein RepC [Aquamicrobium zhengzhouense]|uniref:Replication initiation protein RepC n=1 Tax=Aquamicrobium zhengzhouense TaxID=2781738 RepID=A0ABS0SHH0_9HYPH|nr:plasmid replication protein RepC [Aquamicrobium zhengzhouense]MBI1622755.1 replication initiation protein RepC [Aquamicrobium zhengzhouense]